MNEIIIAEIKEKVELQIKKEDIDQNKLEEKINKACQEACKKIYTEAMEKINDYLVKEEQEKEKVHIHSHRKGTLETLLGPIRYKYTMVKDERSAKAKYYSPLKIGMKMGKHEQITDGLKVKGVMFASNLSYRVASKKVESRISHSTIHKSAVKLGKNIKEEEKEDIGKNVKNDLFMGKSDRGFVEADGIYIPRQGGKKKRMEVKMAICYSGRKDRYKESSSVQKELKDKVVYGDICKSDEFVEKASTFFNYFCNLTNVLHILVLGDGAPWIKDFYKVYDWGAYQLDRFHLLKNLKVFSRKKDELEVVKKLIEENRIDEVLKMIKEKISYFEYKMSVYEDKMSLEERKEEKDTYKKKIKWHEKRIEKVRELLTYIENNKEGINGVDKYKGIFEVQDLVIGSGGIESQVKNTVARRMKGQGKCWKTDGARSMVKILVSLNNNWHSTDDYLRIFSINKNLMKLPDGVKNKIIITKGKMETFRMEEHYKGNIPCVAPSSSSMGYFKKNFYSADYLDILHL